MLIWRQLYSDTKAAKNNDGYIGGNEMSGWCKNYNKESRCFTPRYGQYDAQEMRIYARLAVSVRSRWLHGIWQQHSSVINSDLLTPRAIEDSIVFEIPCLNIDMDKLLAI